MKPTAYIAGKVMHQYDDMADGFAPLFKLNPIHFEYLDEECTTPRPITFENLRFAASAAEWLENTIDRALGTMYKHKHPWLNGYSFQLNELYSVTSDEVNMKILHTAYYSSDNVYENITIPLAWIQDNKLIIDECDRINKKIDEFIKEQAERVKLAKDLTEKALLAELKAKYE
jgi:hypothetical protein